MALAHELFLNHVLDFLDLHEGLASSFEAFGNAAGHRDGRLGIHFQCEEGFANGDFDLLFLPRHDLPVAADQSKRFQARILLRGDLALAVHEHAFGYIICVIFYQSMFNNIVKFTQSKTRLPSRSGLCLKLFAYLRSDNLYPIPVLVGKNVFLVFGQKHVGQSVAYGVHNLVLIESGFALVGNDVNLGFFRFVYVATFSTPIVSQFLFTGNGYEAL